MGNRAVVDITKQLTVEQFVSVSADMLQLTQTPGWQLVLQLIEGARKDVIQMIHDPNVHKEYVSGMLRAIDTIPENVAHIVERGQALSEKQVAEREIAKAAKSLPFVKPGSSTPAM